MRTFVQLSESVKRKVNHCAGLTPFKVFTALIVIELVYSVGKDFISGYIHGAMSVIG
jgi:hypothetical protein